jgi:hypothetical protein
MKESRGAGRGQVAIGYVVPMALLYWWELRERHYFAVSRGLDVADWRTCFYGTSWVVGREVLLSILTGLVVFGG